jgi:hypothetical protein
LILNSKNLKHSHCKFAIQQAYIWLFMTMSVQLAYKTERISRLLPIWYENFMTKDCKIWCAIWALLLKRRRKLLIQQISCYVPLTSKWTDWM